MSTQAWKDANVEKMRSYRKKHYQQNKQAAIDRAAKRRKRLGAWLVSLKAEKCCSVCSESHPACLDFHHRDRSHKILEISRMVVQGWSEEKILREIEKCDVICANCHRKHHWEEKGACSLMEKALESESR